MNDMNTPRQSGSATEFSMWVVALCLLAGCEKPAIQEQHVPKEPPAATTPSEQPSPAPTISTPTPPPVEPPPVPPHAEASSSERPWKVPADWMLVPGERPMRLATYQMRVPSGPVEVAISRFPGDVGGMLANVNRWRGQVGLPPATESDLAAMIEPFENPGFHGSLLHIQGAEQHIVVASILETAVSQTWTVRVSGSPEVAHAVKSDVFAFARTFGAAE